MSLIRLFSLELVGGFLLLIIGCGDPADKTRVADSESNPEPKATEADLPAIDGIYNQSVPNGVFAFDTKPWTAERFREWFQDHDERHPIFVAEIPEGTIAGWASLSAWSAKDGYDLTVENSVFVDENLYRRGIGGQLFRTTLDAARESGFRAIIAPIAGSNDVSVRMHEKAGFEVVGNLREVGRKFGRWLDVTLMELLLNSDQAQRSFIFPQPPIANGVAKRPLILAGDFNPW